MLSQSIYSLDFASEAQAQQFQQPSCRKFTRKKFSFSFAQLMLAIMWNFMLTTHSSQAYCALASTHSEILWDFNSTWIIWSKINRALKRLRERIITIYTYAAATAELLMVLIIRTMCNVMTDDEVSDWKRGNFLILRFKF